MVVEHTPEVSHNVERIEFIPTKYPAKYPRPYNMDRDFSKELVTLCGVDDKGCIRFATIGVYDKKYFALATSTVKDDEESDIQLDILELDVVHKIGDRDMAVWCELEDGSPKLFVGVPEPEKIKIS